MKNITNNLLKDMFDFNVKFNRIESIELELRTPNKLDEINKSIQNNKSQIKKLEGIDNEIIAEARQKLEKEIEKLEDSKKLIDEEKINEEVHNLRVEKAKLETEVYEFLEYISKNPESDFAKLWNYFNINNEEITVKLLKYIKRLDLPRFKVNVESKEIEIVSQELCVRQSIVNPLELLLKAIINYCLEIIYPELNEITNEKEFRSFFFEYMYNMYIQLMERGILIYTLKDSKEGPIKKLVALDACQTAPIKMRPDDFINSMIEKKYFDKLDTSKIFKKILNRKENNKLYNKNNVRTVLRLAKRLMINTNVPSYGQNIYNLLMMFSNYLAKNDVDGFDVREAAGYLYGPKGCGKSKLLTGLKKFSEMTGSAGYDLDLSYFCKGYNSPDMYTSSTVVIDDAKPAKFRECAGELQSYISNAYNIVNEKFKTAYKFPKENIVSNVWIASNKTPEQLVENENDGPNTRRYYTIDYSNAYLFGSKSQVFERDLKNKKEYKTLRNLLFANYNDEKRTDIYAKIILAIMKRIPKELLDDLAAYESETHRLGFNNNEVKQVYENNMTRFIELIQELNETANLNGINLTKCTPKKLFDEFYKRKIDSKYYERFSQLKISSKDFYEIIKKCIKNNNNLKLQIYNLKKKETSLLKKLPTNIYNREMNLELVIDLIQETDKNYNNSPLIINNINPYEINVDDARDLPKASKWFDAIIEDFLTFTFEPSQKPTGTDDDNNDNNDNNIEENVENNIENNDNNIEENVENIENKDENIEDNKNIDENEEKIEENNKKSGFIFEDITTSDVDDEIIKQVNKMLEDDNTYSEHVTNEELLTNNFISYIKDGKVYVKKINNNSDKKDVETIL